MPLAAISTWIDDTHAAPVRPQHRAGCGSSFPDHTSLEIIAAEIPGIQSCIAAPTRGPRRGNGQVTHLQDEPPLDLFQQSSAIHAQPGKPPRRGGHGTASVAFGFEPLSDVPLESYLGNDVHGRTRRRATPQVCTQQPQYPTLEVLDITAATSGEATRTAPKKHAGATVTSWVAPETVVPIDLLPGSDSARGRARVRRRNATADTFTPPEYPAAIVELAPAWSIDCRPTVHAGRSRATTNSPPVNAVDEFWLLAWQPPTANPARQRRVASPRTTAPVDQPGDGTAISWVTSAVSLGTVGKHARHVGSSRNDGMATAALLTPTAEMAVVLTVGCIARHRLPHGSNATPDAAPWVIWQGTGEPSVSRWQTTSGQPTPRHQYGLAATSGAEPLDTAPRDYLYLVQQSAPTRHQTAHATGATPAPERSPDTNAPEVVSWQGSALGGRHHQPVGHTQTDTAPPWRACVSIVVAGPHVTVAAQVYIAGAVDAKVEVA